MSFSLYRVVKSHEGSTDDPLIVQKGDRLTFERKNTEWPGWLWCISNTGKAAWVPESWVKLNNTFCIMLRDYNSTELTINEGEELSVTIVESEWVWGTNPQGLEGWVPLSHLEKLF